MFIIILILLPLKNFFVKVYIVSLDLARDRKTIDRQSSKTVAEIVDAHPVFRLFVALKSAQIVAQIRISVRDVVCEENNVEVVLKLVLKCQRPKTSEGIWRLNFNVRIAFKPFYVKSLDSSKLGLVLILVFYIIPTMMPAFPIEFIFLY